MTGYKTLIIAVLIALLCMNTVPRLGTAGCEANATPKYQPPVVPNWKSSEFDRNIHIQTEPDIVTNTHCPKFAVVNVSIRAIGQPPQRIEEARFNFSSIDWTGTEHPLPNEPNAFIDPVTGKWHYSWSFKKRIDDFNMWIKINHKKWGLIRQPGYPCFEPGSTIRWWIFAKNLSTDPTEPVFIESMHREYHVDGAWRYSTPTPNQRTEHTFIAFEQNLKLTLSPVVVNAYDPVTVKLELRYSDPDLRIGTAYLYYRIKYPNGSYSHPDTHRFYSDPAYPYGTEFIISSDGMTATSKLPIPGMLPGYCIEYYVRAWDDEESQLRGLWSRTYNYTVGRGGAWVHPYGEFTDNINITTDPNVLYEPKSTIVAGQAVNITIKSIYSNVSIFNKFRNKEVPPRINLTLESAVLKATGWNNFKRLNSTCGYFVIDGQPPGVKVTFYLLVYDVTGRSLFSRKYSYHVPAEEPPAGKELSSFYIAVSYKTVGNYVQNADVVVENESGIVCRTKTSIAGFAYLNKTGSFELLWVSYGKYKITAEYRVPNTAMVLRKTITYELTPTSNKTVTIHLSIEELLLYRAPVEFPMTQVYVSYAVFLPFVIPVWIYFSRLRKRKEEEEKKVTL